VSRLFTTQERSLSIFKKEVLALLYTLKALEFYLRSANKVIILIDAKSIIYLRLCRSSEGILLQFSLELSKLNAEIHHVPGPENIVSDVLSRQHKDIKDILEETKYKSVLSEREAEKLLSRLSIPVGKVFTPTEVRHLLNLPSLPAPFRFKPKRSH